MSNGYGILAKVETEDGYVMVREVWGHYAPDNHRTIELKDGETSLYISPETLEALIEQTQLTRLEQAQ